MAGAFSVSGQLVPSIYCIGPTNDGSVFRNGHQIDLVDFAIDNEQALQCSFSRLVPANTVRGHAPICLPKQWPGPFPFQDTYLLAEGKDFCVKRSAAKDDFAEDGDDDLVYAGKGIR